MASLALIITAKKRALTSITGARTRIRMPMVILICMALTSLVRRVISEAVLNRSMLLKEYSWILLYWASRSSAPKLCPAMEEHRAKPMPNPMDTTAIAAISKPMRMV